MLSFESNWLAQNADGCWQGRPPVEFNGIGIDSRAIQPGNLFIAIRGERHDGHSFVSQAFANGARGAIVAKAMADRVARAPLLVVEDPLRALHDLAGAHRQRVKMLTIGVTGSVGKTTVKEMTADILATRLRVGRTQGNWNNEIGLPLSLLSVSAATQAGVFELGTNHIGELAPLCSILKPDWGVITSIAAVHLEHFETLHNIMLEKASLLRTLPPAGVAFLSKDDPWFEKVRAFAPGDVVTVSLVEEADYIGVPAKKWEDEIQIIENASGERLKLRLAVPGGHHVLNALFAVAIGRRQKINWDDIGQALSNYQPQPMRWEVSFVNGVKVINDAYNANPASMRAALNTFAAMPVAGKKFLVLADMLELGESAIAAHEELGRQVAAGKWHRLITLGELGALLAAAARRAGFKEEHIFVCQDHAQAGHCLWENTEPGDAVLLKASRGLQLEKTLSLWQQSAACD